MLVQSLIHNTNIGYLGGNSIKHSKQLYNEYRSAKNQRISRVFSEYLRLTKGCVV